VKRLALAVLLALAICAGALGCLLLWETLAAVRDIHRETLLTIEHLNRDIIVAGGTLANIEKASRAATDAATEQRAYWAQVARRTNEDLRQVGALVGAAGHAVQSLDAAIAHADSEVARVSDASAESARRVGETISALQPGIAALTETATNAARLTGDPALPATLASVRDATASMAGVAADAHAESTLLVGATQKALTPRGKLSAIFHGIIGGTLTAAELFYYLSH